MSPEKGLESRNKKGQKRRSIPAFTLWGAIGFGLGGAIGGAIGSLQLRQN